MATVLCVLYDDPVSGYPPRYSRTELPRLERYPDGQSMPSPHAIDFVVYHQYVLFGHHSSSSREMLFHKRRTAVQGLAGC